MKTKKQRYEKAKKLLISNPEYLFQRYEALAQKTKSYEEALNIESKNNVFIKQVLFLSNETFHLRMKRIEKQFELGMMK